MIFKSLYNTCIVSIFKCYSLVPSCFKCLITTATIFANWVVNDILNLSMVAFRPQKFLEFMALEDQTYGPSFIIYQIKNRLKEIDLTMVFIHYIPSYQLAQNTISSRQKVLRVSYFQMLTLWKYILFRQQEQKRNEKTWNKKELFLNARWWSWLIVKWMKP